MEENKPGKRLAEGAGMSPAAKRGLIVVIALVAVLVAAYIALCAYVGTRGSILPRVTAGGVDVGGLTWQQAQARIETELTGGYQSAGVTLNVDGVQGEWTVPGSAVAADAEAAAVEAANWGHTSGFFAQGGLFLSTLVTGHDVAVPAAFTSRGEAEIDALLGRIEGELGGTVEETTWSVVGDELVFILGTPGRAFDFSQVKGQILDRFTSGGDGGPIVLAPQVTDPAPVDLEELHSQVFAQVQDASLDPETFDITPSVTGLDFNAAQVQSALDGAAWGERVAVALDVTEPKVTTENLRELLFRDVLGEASSKVSGSAARRNNVKLAAASYNERILLPGEVFSYNDTTGSRTADKGYQAAPVYKGGKSVDEVGGGICQPSSTLYYAVLNANLKIVERHNHQFAVGYVPDGMDATVYFGSLDFKFENDTDYPIKILETYENNRLTVQILGTSTTGTTVKMTNEVYEWIPYTTVYQVDPTVPVGTVKEAQNGYNGRKAKSYRNVYDENGELVSSTLETTNKYNVRERILLVNPADAAQYGLSPDGSALPAVTPAPAPTPAVPTEPPAVDPAPSQPVVPTPPPEGEPGSEGTADPSASPSGGGGDAEGIGGEGAPVPSEPPASDPAPAPSAAPTVPPEGEPGGETPVETPPAGIPIAFAGMGE